MWCLPKGKAALDLRTKVNYGKMKQGKSMFLMNVAMDLIAQGAKVLYLDTELSDVLFTRRLISYISGVEAGHGLVKIGSSLVPFVNRVPKDTMLYKLMTTKPGET